MKFKVKETEGIRKFKVRWETGKWRERERERERESSTIGIRNEKRNNYMWNGGGKVSINKRPKK